MPLQILTRPIVEITPSDLSKWNASFSPILYTGTRQDVQISGVSTGSAVSIRVHWNVPAADVPIVGEFVFINSGPYSVSAQVITASVNQLRLRTPFITGSSGGFINLNSARKNHHVELELLRIVDSAYVLVTKSIFRTRPDGTFSFDVSSMLKHSIEFINSYDYVVINERDIRVSGGFNFRVKEVYQGSTEGFSTFDDRDITFHVGAAKQLRDKFGTNMGVHVPILGSIGIFNSSFDISDPALDGWTEVNNANTASFISGGKLLYQSTNAAGEATWTSDTQLVNGVSYEVFVDKDLLIDTEVTIIAGTNEVQLGSTQGLERIVITANGTDFKIRFNSLAGTFRQAQIASVEVFLAISPQPARFLTEDFEPTYFDGFPFDLAFIHSDNLANTAINRNRRFLDLNNTELSISVNLLIVSTNEFAVNRMVVGAVPPDTKCIEVWLSVDGAGKIEYVGDDYVAGEGIDGYISGSIDDNPIANPPISSESENQLLLEEGIVV